MKKIVQELHFNTLLRYITVLSLIVVSIILVMGSYLYRFYYRTI